MCSFISTKLCNVLQRENVGLYHDDRLTIVKQMPGPELDWWNYGIAITIKINFFAVSFLDIQVNVLNSANVKANIGKSILNYWTSISQEDTNFIKYLIRNLN